MKRERTRYKVKELEFLKKRSSPRDYELARAYFCKGESLSSLATRLNISKTRVEQIKNKADFRIRKHQRLVGMNRLLNITLLRDYWLTSNEERLADFEYLFRRMCHKCGTRVRIELKVCPEECGCNPDLNLETAIAWNTANVVTSLVATLRRYHSENSVNENENHLHDTLRSLVHQVDTNFVTTRTLLSTVFLHRSKMPYLYDVMWDTWWLIGKIRQHVMCMKSNFEAELRRQQNV